MIMHEYTFLKSTYPEKSIIMSLNTDFTRYNNYAGFLKNSGEKNKYFSKSSFKCGDGEYNLKKPVTCKKSFEEGLWVIKCDRYNLHVFNESEKEAEIQLDEQFTILCDGLLYEDNDKLTKDAIKLRDKIKGDIEVR